jgi:hypothetical protein
VTVPEAGEGIAFSATVGARLSTQRDATGAEPVTLPATSVTRTRTSYSPFAVPVVSQLAGTFDHVPAPAGEIWNWTAPTPDVASLCVEVRETVPRRYWDTAPIVADGATVSIRTSCDTGASALPTLSRAEARTVVVPSALSESGARYSAVGAEPSSETWISSRPDSASVAVTTTVTGFDVYQPVEHAAASQVKELAGAVASGVTVTEAPPEVRPAPFVPITSNGSAGSAAPAPKV